MLLRVMLLRVMLLKVKLLMVLLLRVLWLAVLLLVILLLINFYFASVARRPRSQLPFGTVSPILRSKCQVSGEQVLQDIINLLTIPALLYFSVIHTNIRDF